jgi:hypothetical protein
MDRRCPESDEIRERYIKGKDKLAKLFARGKPSDVIAHVISKGGQATACGSPTMAAAVSVKP